MNVCVCLFLKIFARVFVCVRVCLCVFVYVCMCVFVSIVRACLCVFTYVFPRVFMSCACVFCVLRVGDIIINHSPSTQQKRLVEIVSRC